MGQVRSIMQRPCCPAEQWHNISRELCLMLKLLSMNNTMFLTKSTYKPLADACACCCENRSCQVCLSRVCLQLWAGAGHCGVLYRAGSMEGCRGCAHEVGTRVSARGTRASMLLNPRCHASMVVSTRSYHPHLTPLGCRHSWTAEVVLGQASAANAEYKVCPGHIFTAHAHSQRVPRDRKHSAALCAKCLYFDSQCCRRPSLTLSTRKAPLV